MPKIRVINARDQKLKFGISREVIEKIKQHLQKNHQVLVFLNRRGYAPVLMCHHCGWSAQCSRCDARLTLHQQPSYLCCHHCESRQKPPAICPQCRQAELMAVGQGTERLTEAFTQLFPEYSCLRIDGDSTRRKNSLAEYRQAIIDNSAKLLVGTQILAKGHHFPNLTLVVMLDIDNGLLSTDFRALELMAQLIVQVSGRAGRAEKPGEVILQTHYPQHPALQLLLEKGFLSFAENLLQERYQQRLPPYSHQAIIRSEALTQQAPQVFLQNLKQKLVNLTHTELIGPMPLWMERKAGKFRQQLILQAPQRKSLHQAVQQALQFIPDCEAVNKVRWSLDIDPV